MSFPIVETGFENPYRENLDHENHANHKNLIGYFMGHENPANDNLSSDGHASLFN